MVVAVSQQILLRLPSAMLVLRRITQQHPAKANDDVTLTFTASEAIGTPVVTFRSGGDAITDGSVVYSNTSGNTWRAVYQRTLVIQMVR